jgi:HPt (histidine-containing phosphotransfer) domain-containing protein
MESVLGSESTREIVRLYLADFPDSVTRLGEGARDDQMRIVHGLKSSSLHVGATRLSELLASLEDRLSHEDGGLAPEEIAALAAEFEAGAPALRRYSGA